jgi:hypothetical protein
MTVDYTTNDQNALPFLRAIFSFATLSARSRTNNTSS